MKHLKRILGIFAVVVVICAVSVTIWQWDAIQAVYIAVTKDPEAIGERMEEIKEKNELTLQGYNVDVAAPTFEQTEALLYGQITPEEVKESLQLDAVIDQPETKADETVEDEATQLVNACTAELYMCQIDLMADLGELYAETQARWVSLGAGRNSATKQQFIKQGLQKCYSLENSTDAAVQHILDQYRSKLTVINADDKVLDELWDIYVEEKNSQKAYYLSQYMDQQMTGYDIK